jgi:hypothetical protein
MIQAIDENRRETSTTEGLGKSLTFNEGIGLIQALPDSIRVRVYYNETDKEAQAYWHSRSGWHDTRDLRPREAIEFIKNQFLRERLAVCVDYHTENFDSSGERLTTHEITFELYDEIFGVIGKEVTLDCASSKTQTVVFYERTPLPGARNWIARKLRREELHSLDYLTLSN